MWGPSSEQGKALYSFLQGYFLPYGGNPTGPSWFHCCHELRSCPYINHLISISSFHPQFAIESPIPAERIAQRIAEITYMKYFEYPKGLYEGKILLLLLFSHPKKKSFVKLESLHRQREMAQ